MNRAQRRDHLRAWIALAILLPILLIAALLARPARAAPTSAAPTPSLSLSVSSSLPSP